MRLQDLSAKILYEIYAAQHFNVTFYITLLVRINLQDENFTGHIHRVFFMMVITSVDGAFQLRAFYLRMCRTKEPLATSLIFATGDLGVCVHFISTFPC
jgi:hypothetical protein